MTQEYRLVDLARLSIECKLEQKINYDDVQNFFSEESSQDF